MTVDILVELSRWFRSFLFLFFVSFPFHYISLRYHVVNSTMIKNWLTRVEWIITIIREPSDAMFRFIIIIIECMHAIWTSKSEKKESRTVYHTLEKFKWMKMTRWLDYPCVLFFIAFFFYMTLDRVTFFVYYSYLKN